MKISSHSLLVFVLFTGFFNVFAMNPQQQLALNKMLVTAFMHDATPTGLQNIINQGATPHYWTGSGFQVLHLAAFRGESEALPLLLKAGANINAQTKDEEKNSPIMLAVQENHKDAVEILLEYNPDLTLTNSDGITAVDLAHVNVQAKKPDSQEILDMLLDAKLR